MKIVGQWASFGGRPDSGNRALEAENRQAMAHRVAQITRVLVEVTTSGNFDPRGTNSLCQWVSYEDLFTALGSVGTEVELVFGLYDQGDDSGRHYHGTRRPPIYNANTITRFAGQFMDWFEGLPDRPRLHSWSCGQEVEYDRTNTYSFTKWWNCWQALKGVMPGNLVRVSSGNSLLKKDRGSLTLNGRLAVEGKAQENNIILVGHFNGTPWDEIYDEMRGIPDEFPGVEVGCNEDRPPNSETDEHSNAFQRGKEVQRAGGLYYGLFTARCTTNLEDSPKPHDKCTWQVNGNTGSQYRRGNIGIEGCWREWNAESYAQAVALAQRLGTWIGGTNLPVNIEDGNGGGGGGSNQGLPKGGHQLCAVINRAFGHAGLTPPGTERLKADTNIQDLIRTLMSRWGIEE